MIISSENHQLLAVNWAYALAEIGVVEGARNNCDSYLSCSSALTVIADQTIMSSIPLPFETNAIIVLPDQV